MSWTLPLTDLELSEEDVAAFLGVLESGWLTMGPRTREFEDAFAARFGAAHAVAVNSCTAAMHLAMLAAGIGDEDEVIVPAMTFVAGAAAAHYCGARPVLAESLGPEDLNLDPEDVERHVGPRTRAILATHWLGYACDLEALERLCRRARAGPDRGLRPEHHRAGRRRAVHRHGRRRGLLLVLLQEAAGGRRGRHDPHRGRGARGQGQLPALSRDDLDDLGAPPGARREL